MACYSGSIGIYRIQVDTSSEWIVPLEDEKITSIGSGEELQRDVEEKTLEHLNSMQQNLEEDLIGHRLNNLQHAYLDTPLRVGDS